MPYDDRMPFISSVNEYAPIGRQISTPWESAGILTSESGEILKLYRRYISRDFWEYLVRDKDDFDIPLSNIHLLEDGDSVQNVDGKPGKGPWKVHIYIKDKYVYV